MSTAHARLSPSNSAQWSVCTASIGFIEENADKLPPNTSKYADEGTSAHALAAKLLESGLQLVPQGDHDEEMVAHVLAYVAFVNSKIGHGDRVYIERKVSLFYHPEATGTVDVIILKKNGEVIIIDLKYGAGVSVYAAENTQLSIYAESALQEIEAIEEISPGTLVKLYIFQPRDRNDSEPVRHWYITRGQLRDFCWAIQEAVDEINSGQVEFVPGEKQCRFCRAKGICPKKAAAELEVIDNGPVDEVIASPALTDLTVPTALTREQRIRILKAKKGLVAWLEAVEDQEMAELLAGAPPMGFKLVEGKSNRKWSDPEAAEKLLRNYLSAEEVMTKPELISIAQAEKKLKDKDTSTKFQNKFHALITRPEGKPSLVPDTDPRPALEINPTAGLRNVSDDDCV